MKFGVDHCELFKGILISFEDIRDLLESTDAEEFMQLFSCALDYCTTGTEQQFSDRGKAILWKRMKKVCEASFIKTKNKSLEGRYKVYSREAKKRGTPEEFYQWWANQPDYDPDFPCVYANNPYMVEARNYHENSMSFKQELSADNSGQPKLSADNSGQQQTTNVNNISIYNSNNQSISKNNTLAPSKNKNTPARNNAPIQTDIRKKKTSADNYIDELKDYDPFSDIENCLAN